MRWSGVLLLMWLSACSSEDEKREKQEECDKIAADIRSAAAARGIAPEGICNNPSATDFKGACDRLRQCNKEVDEL